WHRPGTASAPWRVGPARVSSFCGSCVTQPFQEAVPSEPGIELRAREPEAERRLGLVAPGLLEHLFDGLALDLPQIGGGGVGGCSPRRQRQVMRRDGTAFPERT